MTGITEESFNSLEWEEVYGQQLEELVLGMEICGVEPIDYPLTSWIILALNGKEGEIVFLEIGDDVLNPLVEDTSFYIRMAKAKE